MWQIDMTLATAVPDKDQSTDQHDMLRTIVDCLEIIQPHACAVVMIRDCLVAKPLILSHSGDEKFHRALETFSTATYAIDPFMHYISSSAKSEIYHAADIPKPSPNVLEDWKNAGYPIILDDFETFGYRTQNWPRHMDQISLAFPLLDEKFLEIRLFRELGRGGFDEDTICRLSNILPVANSALQMSCTHLFNPDHCTHRTASKIYPTQRQLEVFRWWAAGKTLEDIGMILGIKRRTVRYHMEKARELYGYSTVQQTAVRIAQDYGLDPLTGALARTKFSPMLHCEQKM